MLKKSSLRARLLAGLLAIPLGAVLLAGAAPEAVAQTQGGWRKEVAEKMQAAQDAGKKGNFAEAIRLLKEAKAKGSLSPQEETAINEYLIYAASSVRDNRLLLQTIDERLATGRVGGADLARKLRLKATTHYSLREYREAKAALDRMGAQSLTTDDLILLGNCELLLRDFRSAAVTLEKAMAGADKAGKSADVKSKLLRGLHEAYQQTGNDAKRMQTLHRLMVVSPGRDSFKWIASAYSDASQRDPVVMINVYRLGASRNVLSSEHYLKYAEVALDLSSPGEAVAMIEKGMAAGAIKKDDRNNRLLADAKSQVERIRATLPQQEREADAIATGEPSAKVAVSYFTLRNYSKAAAAAQNGIKKGKLRRPDDVNMLLGVALVEAKRASEAKAAFRAAGAANEKVRGVADLWVSITT